MLDMSLSAKPSHWHGAEGKLNPRAALLGEASEMECRDC
jgi:hypothetical protein